MFLNIDKIKFDTVDNPGWDIIIDGNFEENKYIFKNRRSEADWMFFYIKDSQLNVKGDITKLVVLIQKIFCYFNINEKYLVGSIEMIEWLQKWYANECDEYWEHLYGIEGEMDSKGNVYFQIDLDETIWEDALFDKTKQCEKNGTKFIITCQIDELVDNITVFKEWVECVTDEY